MEAVTEFAGWIMVGAFILLLLLLICLVTFLVIGFYIDILKDMYGEMLSDLIYNIKEWLSKIKEKREAKKKFYPFKKK
jgi:prepilin signal peptidase PulO-like enzyme (type II secretory pathway)